MNFFYPQKLLKKIKKINFSNKKNDDLLQLNIIC